ncbi:MAG: Gfo/Idh/MocA family oxidoreductase [Planctomycetota bacterium]|nr:Gfo/Idh/MocA family oxidoreductase [Planctomycetota bacterium]
MQRRTLIKAAALGAGAVAAGAARSFAQPAIAFDSDDWVPARAVPTILVGCGRQGRTILTELADLGAATIVAICDPVLSRRRSALRRAPGAAEYDDLEAALAAHPDAEVVIVATSSHRHADPVVMALENQLAVYCEAPLATTEADLQRILAAEKNSFAALHVGMQGRTNPLYAHARDFLRSGAIRDLVSFDAVHHDKQSWTAPARDPKDAEALNWRLDPALSLGLAGEWGVHQFDVFHWFLSEYPTAVRGRGSIQLHKDGREVFDTVHLELEYPGERLLTWEGTLCNSFGKRAEVFCGTAGTIRLAQDAGWLFKESDAPTLGFEVYAGREHFHDEEGITLVVDATKLAAQERLKEGVGLQRSPLTFALESFYKGLEAGTDVEVSGEEGARAVRVAMAACQAVRSGERIEIDVGD